MDTFYEKEGTTDQSFPQENAGKMGSLFPQKDGKDRESNRIPSREEFFQALAARHGEALQRRFQEARVAVCGLGGLGSNIAISLARAGVGSLLLIDFDRVDMSNLNRQQYFVSQLGLPKTEALADTLKRIAPYCEVETRTMKIEEKDIPGLFDGCQVICEAFDRAEAKAMLVQGVLEQYPKAFLVSGVGMAGLGSANTIRTRKLGKHFYLCGDGVSESGPDNPLVSGRVAVCAAHEATMVLRLLAGEEEP